MPDTRNLRVLTIGNSFTVCLGKDLPSLVASIPDCTLELTNAYIGGCSLERHWNNVVTSRENPEARQYRVSTWVETPAHGIASVERVENINSLVEKDCWDIVTIQQASHFSWNPATYHPFGDDLAAYVREKAPRAELRIQQTWAYRSDDPRLLPGSEWGFDQAGMHERLTAAYREFAARLGAPIIPTGEAVRLSRERETRPFAIPAPEIAAACRWPDLPPDSGDVVGRAFWRKNDEGRLHVAVDHIHLNRRGEYLQACVWFLALFGRDRIPDEAYIPNDIDLEDARFLRQCAADAVNGEP